MHIRRQIAYLGVIATLGAATAALAAEGPHWTYKGHGGPAEWGSIEADFATCKLGKLQSPIDIRGAKAAKLSPIMFNYKPSTLNMIDNGHTIQVNYAPGSSIVVGGMRYDLVQFHFHHPSEEKIDGKAHAMVAHLVHKNAEGKLAVVAVLLDPGGASDLIDTLWKNIPKEKGKESTVADTSIDVSKLLPGDRDYYTFQGSLTTPPCSEGVTWFVLKSPVKISGAEVAQFARIYPLNARPVQPLNGRSIEVTK
jgi:carbonic anhydrase